MFSLRTYFLFFCFSLSLYAIDPESQIIIRENFVSHEEATTLIQFYNGEKKDLNTHTDNQLALSSIQNGHIRNIIHNISKRVLAIMKETYPLNGKNYHIDHGGLYSRVPGNYCPYHADNTYFDCPVHGKDQGTLRKKCNGSCRGAKFAPNHTAWREYTALIYLNDDFEGGEILFEDGPFNKLYQKVIPIEARLLVLAPNGRHFYHEVFPIRSGQRYSLHLWFTSDPRH